MKSTAAAALLVASLICPSLVSTSFADHGTDDDTSSHARASASASTSVHTRTETNTTHTHASSSASAHASAKVSSGDDGRAHTSYERRVQRRYRRARARQRRLDRRVRLRDTRRCDNGRGDRHQKTHQDHDCQCGHHHQVDERWEMSEDQFTSLLGQIDQESFSSGRLRVVEMAAGHHYFTSAQVAAIIEAMTFSSTRVEAAVLLYPRVVDQGNFYQVFAAFTFESNKEEVQRRLGL